VNWKEALTKFVMAWRDEFEKLTDSEKKEYLENYTVHYHFLKPCQIEVIEVKKIRRVIWIITRDKARADMEFIIHSNVKESLESFLEKKKTQDPDWFDKFEKIIPKLSHDYAQGGNFWDFEGEITYCSLNYNPLERDPVEYARSDLKGHINTLRRIKLRKDIELTTDQIKSNVERITDTQLRSSFNEATKKLEYSLSQIKRLDEHERKLRSMEEELVGVRKLVGTETFGEWKVLLSEMDKMNTRIDALSDVKDAYDKVLSQQSEVMKQQSSFMNWVKYSTILLPIAVASISIIEILIRHFLRIP